MTHVLAALALAAALGATAPAPAPSCELVPAGPAGPRGEVPVRAETVVSGLEVPWGLAFLPGGDLLVTERAGRLRLVRRGALVKDSVLTLPVVARGEGGLLGIALDPAFAATRRFFLYFTSDVGGRTSNRIASFRLSPDGLRAEAGPVLLDGIPAGRYHDGGRLAIGPDGLLWAGTGDATEPDLARDPRSLAGKVLRLALDGTVPADNPFPGSPVWALGLRNVQGLAWAGDGALLVTDHGPSGELGRRGHDRLLRVPRAGADLGWPRVYGCQAPGGEAGPLLSWETSTPPGGAALYRGHLVPAWKGSLLVGTLGSRHLHRVVVEAGRVALHEVYLAGDPPAGLGRVREVVSGPDGALWVTTSNCDGRGDCPPDKDRVARIVPAR